MAKATLGGDDLACKSSSDDITTSRLPEHWHDLPGLIDDPLIDAGTQVAVLAQIDETGSATLGELMALLPDHANPAEAVTRFVRHGVLTVEPGLLDGNSLLRRRLTPPLRKATDPAGGSDNNTAHRGKGGLRRLQIVTPRPEIFFARGVDRAFFTREPYMRRKGIYLALYGNSAYVGRSGDTACRIAWGAHLRRYGLPELVIAAVDCADSLSEAQVKVAERQLTREVDEAVDLRRLNKDLPVGADVTAAEFAAVDQFVLQVVTAVREAGLAFTGRAAPQRTNSVAQFWPGGDGAGANPAAGEAEGRAFYRLNSCGVVAHARVEDGQWIVLAGSQVRVRPQPSAGSIASRQRQELLYDGGLRKSGNHLLLTKDLTFSTASGAANFVVGSRHKPEIWRPLAAPVEQGPRL